MRPIASRKCYHKFAEATTIEAQGQEEIVQGKLFSAGDNFYLSSITEQDSMGYRTKRLETMDFDSLCIEFEAIFGDQELLNIFALITL